jgi:hypothetical protein
MYVTGEVHAKHASNGFHLELGRQFYKTTPMNVMFVPSGLELKMALHL